jgi:NADP-dependent 3-hydroxy acid dehydrogenase YdfG
MLVFITGATSGIGKSSAILFAKNGYNLVITGRREERLDELKKELETNFKINVTILCFDIRNQNEVETAVHSLSPELKKIDILINNAGLAAGLGPIQDGNLNHWEQMIDTNIKGLLYITKLVSNLMIVNKSGHIINIGSIAGKEVYQNGNVYCATKFAVDALNKGMRIEFSAAPVRVTGIYPGAVETEFSLVRFNGDEERAKKVYEGFDSLLAIDIADAILYAITRPAHVNINELIIMPTAQPIPGIIHRKTD